MSAVRTHDKYHDARSQELRKETEMNVRRGEVARRYSEKRNSLEQLRKEEAKRWRLLMEPWRLKRLNRSQRRQAARLRQTCALLRKNAYANAAYNSNFPEEHQSQPSVSMQVFPLRGGGVPEKRVPGAIDKKVSLVGNEFIPLPNFLPNDVRFRNTCFIAAVLNLRTLLPDIARVLELHNLTWEEAIKTIRAKWENKYSYTEEHGGQHDAAELLADILYEAEDYRFLVKRKTYIGRCDHTWTTQVRLPMLVLSIPEVDLHVSTNVSEMIADYTRTFTQTMLECQVCGMREQEGEVKLHFDGAAPETFVVRVNRYTSEDRRNDSVIPDPNLTLWETAYSLRAVLLHQGSNADSGHYIMYIRNSQGWEKRDDAECVACGEDEIPPCNTRDVYVLVYKKYAALSVVEALAAEQARAEGIRRRMEAERQRQEEEQERERKKLAALAAEQARVEILRRREEAAQQRQEVERKAEKKGWRH